MNKTPTQRAFFVANVVCTDGAVTIHRECSRNMSEAHIHEFLICPASFRMRAIERWNGVPSKMFVDTNSGYLIIPVGFSPLGVYSISELSVAEFFDRVQETDWSVVCYAHNGDEETTKVSFK